MTLIGVHELHGRMHPNLTNLVDDGLLSLLAYLTVSHTHPKPHNKTLVARQRQPNNVRLSVLHMHTSTHCAIHNVSTCIYMYSVYIHVSTCTVYIYMYIHVHVIQMYIAFDIETVNNSVC